MTYFYLLSWLSIIIQTISITLSIGAGLYYLAEIVEEYASMAKRVIKYTIIIDTILAVGLLIFEDISAKIVLIGIFCNLLYLIWVRNFPFVDVYSPIFIFAFVLFLVHNYLAFEFFASNYFQFSQVLCYMTLFCWLVPIGLLVSCSANDNVLPVHRSEPDSSENNNTQYFSGKNKKVGLLSFMRNVRENILPVQTRKAY